MTIEVEQILQEIRNERLRQDQEWGGPEHDDAEPLGHFLEYIAEKLCPQAVLDLMEEDVEDVRRRLIQIAALAVASVESLDRRTLR